MYSSAIIGCGRIFPIHANALQKCPDARLLKVCDISKEKAKAGANAFHTVYCTDYHDLLADPDIDVIHICTPHYLHTDMAVEALKSGKHVLLEKPVGISLSDCDKLLAAASDTDQKIGVCFQNRYNHSSQYVKKLLDSGSAGKIKGARAFVTWNRDEAYYRSDPWRGTLKEEGGGVMINQAIHTVDLLRWFLGMPVDVRATVSTHLLQDVIEVEDTAEALIRFENGARALIYCTNNYSSNSAVFLELDCENVRIRIDEDVYLTWKSGRTEHIVNPRVASGGTDYWGLGHELLINDFYQKIPSKDPFWISPKEGADTLRLVLGMYQ